MLGLKGKDFSQMYMIILAAGQGTRLRPLTDNIPKCLVQVKEKAILDWQLQVAQQAGINDIAIIRGYRKETIDRKGVIYFENLLFETTNMVETLMCAESVFHDGFIVSYGDIIYEQSILESLLSSNHPINVVIDRNWQVYWERRFEDVLDEAESLQFDSQGRITSIGQKPKSINEINGQYIGLMSFKGEGVNIWRSVYALAKHEAASGHSPFGGQRSFNSLYMTDMLQGIIDFGFPIHSVPIQRGWVELDSLEDLEIANQSIEIDKENFRIK